MEPYLPDLPATPKLDCVLTVSREHPEDFLHMRQVAGLSLALWEGWKPLHGTGFWESQLLCCAALLHDVGLGGGVSRHHKRSRDMVLRMRLPALTSQEREIVAQVARYHRKAHPASKHKGFSRLAPHARELVRRLASILRIADGLDRARENAVAKVETEAAQPGLWVVRLWGPGDLGFAAWGAERKAGLFQETFEVALRFEPRGPVLPADCIDKP